MTIQTGRSTELASTVRRWISEQTFDPEPAALAGPGVSLLDDQAARYGDFDDVVIVGVVEHDWPERPRRNIFYPPALLKVARLAVGEGSPRRRRRAVSRSAAAARVRARSSRRSRSTTRRSSRGRSSSTRSRAPGFDERASRSRPHQPRVRASTRRRSRRRAGELRCGALTGRRARVPRTIGAAASRAWSVSALETYLDCPFKFFAQHVLTARGGARRRRGDGPAAPGPVRPRRVRERSSPRGRTPAIGRSRRRISTRARAMFADVVERALEQLARRRRPALERTRLLGSPAAAGLGEAVFRMEAERPIAVVERLLEHRLEGEFTIATAAGPRDVRAARQSRSPRSARGRHVPADRLQARLAAATRRGRCSCRSTASVRRAAASRVIAAGAGRSAKPPISRSRDRSASCRCSRRRPIATKVLARGAAAARRHGRRDRARRVSADAGRCVPLRDVQLRVGLPEGLRRRRLSHAAVRDDDVDVAPQSGRSTVDRPRRATLRRRSVAERRARGVGRHRQDARARRALRQPAARRRRAGPHPRDHVHAQGRRRDAAAHHRPAAARRAGCRSSIAARWRDLKDRLGDIAISTIDAFCLSLLREFPLEADVDPGFDARRRHRGAAAHRASRSIRRCASAAAVARDDDDVALVFAQLGERRLRAGLARAARSPARRAARARRYLQNGPRDLTAAVGLPAAAARSCARSLRDASRRPRARFLHDGPIAPSAVRDAGRRHRGALCAGRAAVRRRARRRPRSALLIDRLRGYFLTQDGKPRGENFTGTGFNGDRLRHRGRLEAASRRGVRARAARWRDAIRAFRRDLNVVLSRGVWRIFAVALRQYQRDARGARAARFLRRARARRRSC